MTNQAATDAFITRKAQIDELLQKLQEASDNHFNVSPDEICYGHVGNLGYVLEKLKEVSSFMFA